MSDGSDEVNVTLFNEFGKSFEKALDGFIEEQVVLVLESAKVNKYEATKEIYLTNYPATRFYINPPHCSVQLLLKRIEKLHGRDEIDSTIYTLKQVKQFTDEFIERKVICHVTVKTIDEKCNWYENFYVKCDNEVFLEQDRYRCPECKRNLPCLDKRQIT
ncbi:uncharacterized protein LOC141667133 [Apium graveolens]|uniref:uncharacterized protein LOC141667133 n=1 Tax=Apium graveolens TaxID=4045 RepID=UPI003D7BB7DD